MLYEAERHESLTASAWNEQAARACINEILDDTVVLGSRPLAFSSARQLLAGRSPEPLYRRAGTIWALCHLSGKPNRLPDFLSVVPWLLEPNRNWVPPLMPIATIPSVNSCGVRRARCWRRCGSMNGRAKMSGLSAFAATRAYCGRVSNSSRRPAAFSGFRSIARSRCRTRLSSIEAIIPRYQRVCLYAPTAASTCPFP